MISLYVDRYLVPILIPSILGINCHNQVKNGQTDLIYMVTTFAAILSTIHGPSQLYLKRYIRYRSRLTLTMALLITLMSLAAVLGFNIIRSNINSYDLPQYIKGKYLADFRGVFEYHFFADFLPGLVIFSSVQLYSLLLNELLCKAKRKFSLGEASIVAQLISLAFLVWALSVYSKLSGAGPFQLQLSTDLVLNLGAIVIIMMFLPSYFILRSNDQLSRYVIIFLTMAACYTRSQGLIKNSSELDPLTWLIEQIFMTHQRLSLFCLWLSTLTACISFSTTWSKMVGQTNCLARKIFHLAMCVVFISGFNQDLEFTRFAAGGVLVVLLILEMIRAWQLKPLGPHLENVCQSLRGKWDNKYLTLSHIYLLLGVFSPLWLLPPTNQSKLMISSGLISVGIGDTAAAAIGTILGKNKVSGKSDKTLEGLAANAISMVLFKLVWIGYSGFINEFSFVFTVLVTSFIEALIDTCDNLILPLVTILFLEIL